MDIASALAYFRKRSDQHNEERSGGKKAKKNVIQLGITIAARTTPLKPVYEIMNDRHLGTRKGKVKKKGRGGKKRI